ncbi:group 1 glycosyl transferase, partial [Marivirga lumbricoides]
DIELICSILNNHSDKTLVIVGLISLKDEILEKLESYNNILFISPKPIEALPAYLCYSDCAIIPFKINELTNSIYPLKINEYLAMGIPVVSTKFSEDIIQFSEVISLANNKNDFCQHIDFEIIEDNEQKQVKRKEAAKNNTWKKRVEQFWKTTIDQLKDSTNA